MVDMVFKDVLRSFMYENTRCFINSMPKGDGGIIKDILSDYLVFEVVATKERILMPLDKITHVSEGMKPNPIEIISKGKTIKILEHDILKIENGKVFVREENDVGYIAHEIDKDTEELLKQVVK